MSDIDSAIDDVIALNPSVVLLFAAPAFFQDIDAKTKLKERLSAIPVIGTSTAGEISNGGVTEGSVTFFAIKFNDTLVRTACAPLLQSADSHQTGQNLAVELHAANLQAVIIFGPGTNVNGTSLIEGLVSRLDNHVIVTGGLAGDNLDFKKTYTICNAEMLTDHAVAVGFYGDSLVVGCGAEGGWRPFGPARRVTKAKDNILYEIDGKPALRLYKQYLGEKARQLPASGLLYPFAILRDDRTISGVIRTALDIDHEKEALILAGDIPENCRVCLMHADTDALTQGAAQAAAEALRMHAGAEENGCALIVSCVGRKMVYGIDAEEEIEAVEDSFLPNAAFGGYYSYGEICSYHDTRKVELHNQTMCITYFTEKARIDE